MLHGFQATPAAVQYTITNTLHQNTLSSDLPTLSVVQTLPNPLSEVLTLQWLYISKTYPNLRSALPAIKA